MVKMGWHTMYTAEEAAEFLGATLKQIKELITKGRLQVDVKGEDGTDWFSEMQLRTLYFAAYGPIMRR